MKRAGVVTLFLLVGVVLSGCSLDQITQWVETKTNMVVKQDQQNEQGYVLTSEEVYAAYDTGMNFIRLENRGLTAVPDFCTLLLPEDHPKIAAISLTQNNIKIINTDLSCLTNLKLLNLSYNQIVSVQTLGSLPSLVELRLHKNQITTTEDFPDLPALSKLTLAFNQLKEVKDIEQLQNLAILELHHNLLEKVEGVEQLQKLTELKVEYNKLKEDQISYLLDNLKGLWLFTVKGNDVKQGLLNKLDELNSAWVQKNVRGLLSGSSQGTGQ